MFDIATVYVLKLVSSPEDNPLYHAALHHPPVTANGERAPAIYSSHYAASEMAEFLAAEGENQGEYEPRACLLAGYERQPDGQEI